MPEGAECALIATQLHNYIAGKEVVSLSFPKTGRYRKDPPEGAQQFQERLPRTVLQIQCHGKFIWWVFGSSCYLFNTLGMTGSWGKTPTAHTGMSVNFDDGTSVHFNDPRHFGTLKFAFDRQQLTKKLSELGPDMLSKPPHPEEFGIALNGLGRLNITQALMNQKIISGVGNYVKAEALYRARISPWRTCESLTVEDCNNLHTAIITVLTNSYRLGGATLATYKDFEGSAGQFDKQLQVYKKPFDPEGRPVVGELTPDKRTTWWVKSHQK